MKASLAPPVPVLIPTSSPNVVGLKRYSVPGRNQPTVSTRIYSRVPPSGDQIFILISAWVASGGIFCWHLYKINLPVDLIE